MIRGTTPTFKLKVNDENIDFTQAANVYATFQQRDTEITKTGEDLEVSANEVDVYLTQEETLKFKSMPFGFSGLKVQLNWTYSDGKRASTLIKTINVTENLLGEVLE